MKSKQKPVAIVTGVSGGVGLGITLAFIKHGYDVVGTSRSISESKGLKASSDLVPIDGDISKKETAAKVAEAAIEHFGRVDLLVNNAGIFLPKPFTEYTEDDYN
jgi:NAD(P)-dependent dehydrogenase (short-subunit alcohol dehydrogenase family)